LLADFKSFIQLINLIKEFKPDVIHTHTAKAGVLGRLASLLAGKGAIRVHTFHGHLLHGYFSPAKTQIVIAIEKGFAKATSTLIAVGNKVRDDLLAAGIGVAGQYKVFFPGLRAPKVIDKSRARENLNLEPSRIYCTFVGRLTQIKRPDRLLDVAAEMKSRGTNIHFIVAGEGELFESSKKRAQHQSLPITFLGWRNDIEEILAASDAAILTSDNEGIPLTLIQAAFAGLPIVSTDVGSISDIVIDQSNGYLTPLNVSAMADALEKLIRDEKLRELMGASGKSRARELFSLEKMLQDHSDLYQSR
jgi:glycosyltransferase involved in cell wall biosynthesis